MSTASVIHIKNWLQKAHPDYYTMFMKAWIPLNAWYVQAYGTRDDKEAIEKLKNGSKVKNRIVAMLEMDDLTSRQFRQHLALLHNELESRGAEHNGTRISFTQIPQEGIQIKPATDSDKNGNVYIASQGEGYFEAKIVRDKGKGKSLMDKKFTTYDLQDLLKDSQYVGLGDKLAQEKIRLCYQQIDPKRNLSLVVNYSGRATKLKLDKELKVAFIDDKELIAKSIIGIIYKLRCSLFHGEIDPTSTNQGIYEHAFYILKSVIKELD